jgi:hypothetical protein
MRCVVVRATTGSYKTKNSRVPSSMNWTVTANRGRILVFACGLLIAVLPNHAVAAPQWRSVSTTQHGLRLTLSVPAHALPQNALMRVWTRMTNLTRHTIYLWDSGPMAPGKYIPQVEVLAANRTGPLPISLTDYFPYPGPAPFAYPLFAGATQNRPDLIILRGPLVRLKVDLAHRSRSIARQNGSVTTRALRIHLTAPDTPAVSLQMPPKALSADIVPAGTVHGRPLAVWYANCGDTQFDETFDWTAESSRIEPGCSPAMGWHVIIGWLNHSVGQIDWGST